MARNGTVIRKFFLHISKKEQKKRFLARLMSRRRIGSFGGDIHERKYWDEYQDAYEDMIRNTATEHAPWYVVPADNKWFTRLVISCVLVDTLESLKLAYPKVDDAKKKELQEGRKCWKGRAEGCTRSCRYKTWAVQELPCVNHPYLKLCITIGESF